MMSDPHATAASVADIALDAPLDDADAARLVAAYPLPDGVEDAVLNKGQLAIALDLSETFIDKLTRAPGLPILERGTNGVAWQFQLSTVWAWRQAGKARDQAEASQADKAARQMRLAVLNLDQGDRTAGLSPKERRELLETQAAYLKAARNTREQVPTTDVVELIEMIFGAFRAALETQPDEAARALGLDAAAIGRLEAINDKILSGLVAKLQAAELDGAPLMSAEAAE